MAFSIPTRKRDVFSVLILRPSKYDDEGYVYRYVKGVLPSNTLSALGALTRKVFDDGRFGADTDTDLVMLDDTVQNIHVKRLARKHLGRNRRAVVAFAGVQSNQFPRARDLALRFKEAGFEVMIGGFHVSGAIAMMGEKATECHALMARGVTLVKGEVEDVWGDLLEDAYDGRLKPFYDIVEKPDISEAPIPLIDPRYQKRIAYKYMGTIDTSRGCPFDCSFCTIINVQGRKMRCRSAETVAKQVRENFFKHGIDYYFFTDDNFSRNTNWEAVLDALIALREEENVHLKFMMQVDAKAWRLPRFIDKAARAGCCQVFLGVESLNADNLRVVGKTQNVVDEVADMVAQWHDAGVACHAGYVIGFPYDTSKSVRGDVARLKESGFDQCSFFMLTPLPGSKDHAQLVEDGVWMAPDYNDYDSYHETLRLTGFDEGEWFRSCVDAWESFYSFDNMREILKRSNKRTYWGLFKNFMWYRSALLEGAHPMVAGLWRLRPRTDRRPGYAVEGRLRHWARRARDGWETLREWRKLFFELQELWLQTRIRSDSESAASEYFRQLRERWEGNVAQWGESLSARRDALGERAAEVRQNIEGRGTSAREWAEESAASVRESIGARGADAREWVQESADELSSRLRSSLEYLHEKSPLRNRLPHTPVSRVLVWWNSLGYRRFIVTRGPLNSYWRRLAVWARQGRLLRLSFETPRIGVNILRDARLTVTFCVYFFNELTCD